MVCDYKYTPLLYFYGLEGKQVGTREIVCRSDIINCDNAYILVATDRETGFVKGTPQCGCFVCHDCFEDKERYTLLLCAYTILLLI